MRNFQRARTYSIRRLDLIWIVLIIFFAVVLFRLFYLQIIRHDYFLDQANASQIKSLQIEADRGKIYAFNDKKKVPLVVNQRRWTMFSDTKFIEDSNQLISALADLKVELSLEQKQALSSDSRYVVLKKHLTDDQKDQIESNLKVKGVYFQKQSIRNYLEGRLASQVLGFVNNDAQGQYGIEQSFDEILKGTPGKLRITTDVHDIPLLFVEDNIFIEPQAGQDLVLTLDVALQRIVEQQLKKGILETSSKSGSALILNAETGAILAMANYPDFDPSDFQAFDLADYVNDALESVLEPASVMKVLLMAAALNEGVVSPDDTYYNPLVQIVDGLPIRNLAYFEQGVIPVTEILIRSLNTGSVEMLKRLGSGPKDQVDITDRQIWHDYLVNKFRFQQKTGISLPNEVSGNVHPPDLIDAPNHLYATSTFGQSITVTPLQLAAAYAAIFNGGDYYQPYIVAQVGDEVRQPKQIGQSILTPKAFEDLLVLMSAISKGYFLSDLQYEGLEISSKTGSAQVVDFERGGYIDDVANGLMVGYIKNQRSTLIILVVVKEPQVLYAGPFGAGPIWKGIARNLISLGRVY